jgi:hypothetical protein
MSLLERWLPKIAWVLTRAFYLCIDAGEAVKVGDSSSLISKLVLEPTEVEIPQKFV